MGAEEQETTTLDRLDRQLLHALRIDGRVSFRRVAEVLGSSEQTIARRYRRLREGGVCRVLVLPAAAGPGLEWFVRLGMRPGSADRFAEALAQRPDTSWVTINAGGAEIVCLTRPASPQQRDVLLLDRLPRTNHVTSIVAHAILRSFSRTRYERWSAYGDELEQDQQDALLSEEPDPDAGARIEAGDRDLIAALAKDGRASYADLAAATGWSPSRVTRRLEALLRSGALYVDVDLALDLLGFPTVANVWMTVAPSDLEEVGWHVAGLAATAYAAAVSGPSNLYASVVCRDTSELYSYLSHEIGAIGAVRATELSPVIRRVKQSGSILQGSRLPPPV
jgi:DNA-binding Lrp family transcriptional regulator